MSKGKYLVPVHMGQPGNELYLIKGELPAGQSIGLARCVKRRGVTANDLPGIGKMNHPRMNFSTPAVLTEVEIVSHDTVTTRKDCQTIEQFIRNTLYASKNLAELEGWYTYERKGELIPLKIAKFSINLLDEDTKQSMIDAVYRRR